MHPSVAALANAASTVMRLCIPIAMAQPPSGGRLLSVRLRLSRPQPDIVQVTSAADCQNRVA